MIVVREDISEEEGLWEGLKENGRKLFVWITYICSR
jgi:hypothetical protein